MQCKKYIRYLPGGKYNNIYIIHSIAGFIAIMKVTNKMQVYRLIYYS